MNDALALHIGRRLRTRRRLLDLSQAALGADCGMSFQTIHKYEAGSVQISAAALFALANALEVSTSYFFEGFGRSESRAATSTQESGTATA